MKSLFFILMIFTFAEHAFAEAAVITINNPTYPGTQLPIGVYSTKVGPKTLAESICNLYGFVDNDFPFYNIQYKRNYVGPSVNAWGRIDPDLQAIEKIDCYNVKVGKIPTINIVKLPFVPQHRGTSLPISGDEETLDYACKQFGFKSWAGYFGDSNNVNKYLPPNTIVGVSLDKNGLLKAINRNTNTLSQTSVNTAILVKEVYCSTDASIDEDYLKVSDPKIGSNETFSTYNLNSKPILAFSNSYAQRGYRTNQAVILSECFSLCSEMDSAFTSVGCTFHEKPFAPHEYDRLTSVRVQIESIDCKL